MRFGIRLTCLCFVLIPIMSSNFRFLLVASESTSAEETVVTSAFVAEAGGDVSEFHGAVTEAQVEGIEQNVKIFSENNVTPEKITNINSFDGIGKEMPITQAVGDEAGEESSFPSPADERESSDTKNTLPTSGSEFSDVGYVPISADNVLQLESPQVQVSHDSDEEPDPGNVCNRIDAAESKTVFGELTGSPDSLQDISAESPTVTTLNEVTSTELPPAGVAEPHTINPVIISEANLNLNNETMTEQGVETAVPGSKDDQVEKINDSGGSVPPQPVINEDTPDPASPDTPTQVLSKDDKNLTSTSEMNLTAEEVPIPVFSEWAQKQMEAAEKQQLQQDAVNSSIQKRNQTNGQKQTSTKVRTKNYASPDCGAKIIASNADAQNTGAILTSSKDEYMLSPCTNRIWFVIELCEAIQAETIDLANFELFSSSPKNFTVAVSNRFPTREWLNVGRFIAEDKRTVQTFDLHPHLFGKFVRADVHSHYNSEHFCPISLFRVYGTSEFEAFETENRAADDIEEYDDEIAFEPTHQKNENNLFKSASDAVLSIVKKAAEFVGKTNSNQTATSSKSERGCITPSTPEFVCNNCENSSLATRVNHALSCDQDDLNSLLKIHQLRNDIVASQICAKQFSINLNNNLDIASTCLSVSPNLKTSYFLSLLSHDYLGGMCHLLAIEQKKSHIDSSYIRSNKEQDGEVALNLTIEKENKDEFDTFGSVEDISIEMKRKSKFDTDSEDEEVDQIPAPPKKDDDFSDTTEPTETSRNASPVAENLDVNIFNLRHDNDVGESAEHVPPTNAPPSDEQKLQDLEDSLKSSTASSSAENDSSSWDNLDSLLNDSASTGTFATLNNNNHGTQSKGSGGPHSESVFIRLNNRIKALERNMSLSGQYLEELSRRYKKQVEELQQSLTKTVRALEEQNQRHAERERLLLEQNNFLKDELDDVSLQVHACIILIIFVGSVMLLLTILGVFFYRPLARARLQTPTRDEKRKTEQKKMKRRKSFDDFSDGSTGKQKIRRPSEEAMIILKDCSETHSIREGEVSKPRQRKISVCYPKKPNRKDEASSRWLDMNTSEDFDGKSKDCPPAEPVDASAVSTAPSLDDERYDNFNTTETNSNGVNQSLSFNGKNNPRKDANMFNGKPVKLTRKHSVKCKRQDSSSGNLSSVNFNEIPSFDEKLILDDDDIENFLPGADMAYNEFMPNGPSGYQVTDGAQKSKNQKSEKKSRRFSSPAFLKHPFSKSNKKSPPHEPTSWEWCRSKKPSSTPSSQQVYNGTKKSSEKVNGFGRDIQESYHLTPVSSLSEIIPQNEHGNSENSFRILEEAINTATSSSSAGNSGCGSNSGSSASSGRSSKKNRSFNRIFKKVF